MLKIENVSYRYKGSNKDVLKQLNAEFETGEVYAILGPSGSGKTTLLSILTGLDSPTEGSVFIEGMNISELDMDMYRREMIGMVFQSFLLFPLLTAVENVSFTLESSGIDKKTARTKAKTLLDSVGITDDKYKRYPSNLSGGEQQRVAIARTLASGAKIILADEPTGNLDAENGEAVIGILKKLACERESCIIIVTHNLEIANIADVVYRISDGAMELVV